MGSVGAFLQCVSESSAMVQGKAKGSFADVRVWAFVSVPLPTACIHTPRLFQLLKMQTELSAFTVSQLCLPVSVSDTVGDVFLYPLQQQPGGTSVVEKAEGRKSRGILGKI